MYGLDVFSETDASSELSDALNPIMLSCMIFYEMRCKLLPPNQYWMEAVFLRARSKLVVVHFSMK